VVSHNILQNQKIKSIFMLRQPEQSIKSIMGLFSKKNNSHQYAEPEHATRYYIKRCTRLLGMAKFIPNCQVP
jgi:hypothetical protein